jgi:hypothetical protein
LIEWADLACKKYHELRWLHSINNGAYVSIGVAVKLKKAGTRRGIPDLMLPVARDGFHGLYIEMKRQKGGHVDPDQKECHAFLIDQGYRVDVCRGWEAAKRVIVEYLESK